jgi:signal transduction histidine kinase
MRRRSLTLVTILIVTLGLAGFLTYEAWDSARSRRRDAENTIKEYAAFAAWEYNASVKEYLYESVIWMLSPVNHMELLQPGEPLPPARVLAYTARSEYRCDPEIPSPIFRIEIPSGRVTTHGPSVPAAFTNWIRDTVLAEVTSGRYTTEWSYSAIFGKFDKTQRTVVYQVKWNKEKKPVAAYGFQLCMRTFASMMASTVMTKGAILPPSVTQGLPNDSLFSVVVKDGWDEEIWRSPVQYESPFKNTNKVEYLGALKTEITFRPDIADRLLIGGLPSSKLPLLLGALALTLTLVVLGLLQLKREEQLARLRSDFVASVSHELRTPLAQLRMFAETLLLGRVRSEQERTRSLEIIDQESRRLSHLVENILQFSRSERQSLQLQRNVHDLSSLVRETVEMFAPVARARKVEVDVELDDSVRGFVDVGAMRQIVLNLLDNAVKYGPSGQRVKISLAAVGNTARLTVDDEGPGIPAKDRLRIWKAFQRLERDVNSAVAGSGIGLAVVCDLILAHDGKAWVEENPNGHGARFVVELPRQ